jgi:ribonuclease P protein component
VAVCGCFPGPTPGVDNRFSNASSILALRLTAASLSLDSEPLFEAHLPAQRPSPEAQARLSRPHVDPRRAGDPEAPAGQGPQAALRLSPPDYPRVVQRRHRLSRSRDFDAVYRSGRSASTRFLVLYWFPRDDADSDEPRLGLAVPKSVGNAVVRNRVKRQLRETWTELADRARPGHDYVLVARPGLAEPADTRGHEWLAERVNEVLEKAAA